MTEVTTSNSTTAPCSPPRAETISRIENTDLLKSTGSLTFRIDNVREFSNSPPNELISARLCDAKVSVRGLTFGLAVCPVQCLSKKDPTQKKICMGIMLFCENASGCDAKGDGSWSCLATVTMRIKFFKSEETASFQFTHRFFSSKEKSSLEWIDSEPWNLNELMYDPYKRKEDTLELVAEISVDAPSGVMELPKKDIIQVNGKTLVVNKNQLAMNSPYFHSLFYNAKFDEGKNGEYKVQIEEPANMMHFKRMLATMWPMNKPLDDQCIEGVLHLANQFLVTDVEGKCLEFLREESKKPALFKYRMADKYGYTALKNHVLDNLKATDFEKELFTSNMDEYNQQLGSSAAKALKARYNALCPPKI